MEKKGKSGTRFVLVFITGVITGILIGVSALSALISYRMDRYYQEVRKLQTIIEEKDVKLKKLDEKLEESVNRNKLILKGVEVVLNFGDGEEEDEIDRMTLEKHIKEKYNHLLGQEVKSIDVNIAAEVIDKRIFKIDDREYKLKVSRITLAEVLTIWVNVEVM